MPNKKTVKRNKRNSKRSRSRKGGFFGLFDDKHNTGNAACNPDNLVNLKSSFDIKKNIDTCCPKNWYGRKNNSPYCKQLNLNYDAALTQLHLKAQQSNANGVYIDDNDPDGLSDEDIAHLQAALYQHNTVGEDQINCKDKNFAQSLTTQQKMEKYIEACECNKTRWNPFSDKKANCAIVKPKLERVKQEREEQERDTLVTNPIQQNNGYNPIPNQEEDQRPSVNYPDDDIPPPPPVNAEGVPPVNSHPEGEWKVMGDYNLDTGTQEIDTVGGKRRKTKKHFKKRSIRKRSIKKRSIKKRKGRKY